MWPWKSSSPNQSQLQLLEERVEAARLTKELTILESENTFLANIFNPMDELYDPYARAWWSPVGSYFDQGTFMNRNLYDTEMGRLQMRSVSRQLALENPFAINAIENTINYTVGTGMVVEAKPEKVQDDLSEDLDDEFTNWYDEFVEGVAFDEEQIEIVRRGTRDGEVFVRSFRLDHGTVEHRFVEPGDVSSNEVQPLAGETFGIQTDPTDVTKVVAYRIQKEMVPADQVHHLKLNVDANVKRGIPTLWCPRMNLIRAGKLLENVSTVAAFQAAIGAVRYHKNPMQGALSAFADRQSDASVNNPISGRTERVRKMTPGVTLDMPDTVKMEFPSTGVDVTKIVDAQKAELRAAAARLVMPEFMLTSDASNANYSSTMVAEGPPFKMFKRLQAFYGRFFAVLILEALIWAEEKGTVSKGLSDKIKLKLTGPEIISRDILATAQAKQILYDKTILSAQTWASQEGLDYETEQRNIDDHATRGPLPGDPGADPNAVTNPLDPSQRPLPGNNPNQPSPPAKSS